MADDAVLICLIEHSVFGHSDEERQAARLLLDLRKDVGLLARHLEQLSSDGSKARLIAAEANKLITRYELM